MSQSRPVSTTVLNKKGRKKKYEAETRKAARKKARLVREGGKPTAAESIGNVFFSYKRQLQVLP